MKQCITILLVFLFVSSISCKHSHHSSSHHSFSKSDDDYYNNKTVVFDMSGDPNELLPAPCVNGEVMTRGKHQQDLNSWKNCPVKREEVMAINQMGFDINGDGSIDMDECNQARHYYLSWIERTVAESCDKVFEHCDCDGDGKISKEDFQRSVFTCLRNCKAGVMINHYIGSRMVNGKAFSGKQEGV
jgi:hypothetical protein